MKQHIVVLVLVIICSIPSFSQTDYLITLQKDTVYGEISILLPSKFIEEIILKKEGGEKQQLKAFQFYGFQQDGKTYHTISYSNKYRIMRLVHPGDYMSLYYFRSENSYDFGNEFLYKITNEGQEISSIRFTKSVSKFIEDCPELAQRVEEKEYKKSDLNQLIDDYNEYIIVNSQRYTTIVAAPTDTPKLNVLRTLKGKIRDSANDELITLLDDIIQKVRNNEKVPSYLIGALKEHTANMEEVKEEVAAVLKLL